MAEILGPRPEMLRREQVESLLGALQRNRDKILGPSPTELHRSGWTNEWSEMNHLKEKAAYAERGAFVEGFVTALYMVLCEIPPELTSAEGETIPLHLNIRDQQPKSIQPNE